MSGALSYFSVFLIIILIIYGALNQNNIIGEINIFGIALPQDYIILIMFAFINLVVFGWLSIILGNFIKCKKCNGKILNGELLEWKAVWIVFKGYELCRSCYKEVLSENKST